MPLSVLRKAIFVVFLSTTSMVAQAGTVPLLPRAQKVFKKAGPTALAEIKKNGIAGLNGTLQDCYGRAAKQPDLKAVQYCFAMHVAAMRYDMAVIQSLGGQGSSSGMDVSDAVEMASPAFHHVGYADAGEILSILESWIDAFLKE
ncbi:hypothetical protein [Microvirga rosea]|uniref:hypothetical protein n=1 Tax=Microvirga rosea TaxID=2715425 RepID=UPI001D0B8286|nr:hypothetical protein [Microvirga rosea]MCB8819265.1 hypothetical protein [Microvirga rosea]